ncbi:MULTISPECIES: hypothetical protein [Lactobacillus]|uniref:Uncharacterized protein n=1 Tax=Lactobacillus xujianguonis TaxID=2495899 RepID=A0A437STA1_9LACO|nr:MULTISPECIES: hypothetical protein [Lactobacillus]RVU70176.1 hypothetical protein EJK17_09090 [Lactobacillus xujianguonis]RVU73519.1 hypothetical protein EJK20_07750 [Lactobacillus xujianguonis]
MKLMKPYDKDEATVFVDGASNDYCHLTDDMKRMVPFKITIELKPEAMKRIKPKVGSKFEMQLKGPYHYEGKVTKIEGNKITVEGKEPFIQVLNAALENVDTMK